MVKEIALEIEAKDGFLLSSILFVPAEAPKGVVILNAALAVKKEFYAAFAHYLALNGYVSVVFDYRGTGGSVKWNIRNFRAHLLDWAEQDIAGVINWAAHKYPGINRFVIGHSMGGKLMGFVENHSLLKGVVLIATGGGNYRNYPFPDKYLYALLWYGLIPVIAPLKGYYPGSRLGMGLDIPKDVALDWAAWCRNRNYVKDFIEKTGKRNYFAEIAVALKLFLISDDRLVPDETAMNIYNLFINAQKTTELIDVKKQGVGAVGHFGFFSRRFENTLWKMPLAFLQTL